MERLLMCLAALVCIALGIFMLAKPELCWKLEHFLDTIGGEPSDWYLTVTRLAGVLFLLLGVGILLFLFALIFQVVTLPVEFNASARAIRMLESTGILGTSEVPGAKKVLGAAAMTYVAAVVGSLLQLLRLLILSGRIRNDD